MISKEEIDKTILELESKDTTYAVCERLAWLYIVRDHLTRQTQAQPVPLDTSGESDFLQMINGKDSVAVWKIMDDLIDTIRVTNPRVYNSILQKIKNL